jgi:hypothetical protein
MTTAAELEAVLVPLLKDDGGRPRAVWQASPCLLDYFIPPAVERLPLSCREVMQYVNTATGLSLTHNQTVRFIEGWRGESPSTKLTGEIELPFWELGSKLHGRWLMEKWFRPVAVQT